jgi:mono/diheme cytochrome c family protein
MTRKKTLLAAGAVVLLLAVAFIVFALRFDLSALPEPGAKEVALATRAKHLLVGRASRHDVPLPPVASAEGLAEGKTRYGVECAACHGMDGRGLTDNGRWMYPRAADLTSPAVQDYSDQELFWIVKNGIRLSGMPAFGRVESDGRIWRIAQYIRALRSTAPPAEKK